MLRPTTVEEEKFSEEDVEDKRGKERTGKRQRDKRKKERRGKREKRGKMLTFTTMEKEKKCSEKQRRSCSQQTVHLGCVVEKVFWNPPEMMFHERVIIPSIFPAVRKYDKMLCLLCT